MLLSGCELSNNLSIQSLNQEPGCFVPFTPNSSVKNERFFKHYTVLEYSYEDLSKWRGAQYLLKNFEQARHLVHETPYLDEWSTKINEESDSDESVITNALVSARSNISEESLSIYRLSSKKYHTILATIRESLSCRSDDYRDCVHFSNEAFIEVFPDGVTYHTTNASLQGHKDMVSIRLDAGEELVRGCDPETGISFERRDFFDMRAVEESSSSTTAGESFVPLYPEQPKPLPLRPSKYKTELSEQLGSSFELNIPSNHELELNTYKFPTAISRRFLCWDAQSNVVSCDGLQLSQFLHLSSNLPQSNTPRNIVFSSP